MVIPEYRTVDYEGPYARMGAAAGQAIQAVGGYAQNQSDLAQAKKIKETAFQHLSADMKQNGASDQEIQQAHSDIMATQSPQELGEKLKAYSINTATYKQVAGSDPTMAKFTPRPMFGESTTAWEARNKMFQPLAEKAKAMGVSQNIADVQSGAATQQSIQNTLPNQPVQGSPQLTTRSLSSQMVGPELSPAMKQFPETTPEGNVVPMAKDQSVISPIRTHAGMLQTPQNLPQPTPTPEETAAAERTMQMYQSPEQMASADRSTSGTPVSSEEAAGAYSRAGVSESPIAKTDVAARQKAETLQQKEGTAEDKANLTAQKLEIDKEKAMQQLELKQKSLDWQKEYQQGLLDAKKEFNRILAAANNVKALSSRSTTEKDKTDLVAKLMKMKVDAQEKLSSANMLFGDEKGKQDITTSINDIEDMITRLQATKMSTGPSSGVPIKPKTSKVKKWNAQTGQWE